MITVQQMFNSLPILQRVINLKLPLKKAYKVYSLTKAINEQREFFIKEEQKLIAECGAQVLESGDIKFETPEMRQEFAVKHNDLMNYEVNLESIELSFDDLGEEEFTVKDLVALEGVINFVE